MAAADFIARWLAATAGVVSLLLAATTVLAFASRRASAAATSSLCSATVAGVLLAPVLIAAGFGWPMVVPSWVPLVGEPVPGPGGVGAAVQGSLGFGSWIVASAWLFGVAVTGVHVALRAVRVTRLVRGAPAVSDGPIALAFSRLVASTGARAPQLRMTAENVGAFSCGVRRPVVVLPASARDWGSLQTTLVLRHEIAHVRRRDALVLAGSAVALAVHWYNPLVWLANRLLRDAIERACDDAVLDAGVPAEDYAEVLVRLARDGHRSVARVASMGFGAALMARVDAILDADRSRSQLSRPRQAGLVSCVVGVVVLVSASVLPFRHREPRPPASSAPLVAHDVRVPAPTTGAEDGRTFDRRRRQSDRAQRSDRGGRWERADRSQHRRGR